MLPDVLVFRTMLDAIAPIEEYGSASTRAAADVAAPGIGALGFSLQGLLLCVLIVVAVTVAVALLIRRARRRKNDSADKGEQSGPEDRVN